jgi:protein-disulfide isomerase
MAKRRGNAANYVLIMALAGGAGFYLGGQSAPGADDAPAAPALDCAAAEVLAKKCADRPEFYKLAIGDAHVKGAKDALVTIVEISDFQCPYCSRGNATMSALLKDPKNKDLRLAFFHNPLSFHKDAMPAALAAEAAGRQGKFWEMHDKMFANQKALKSDNFDKWAGELKLDMAKFKADMKDAKLTAKIKGQQAAAAKLGARGTPAFFINGEFLSGARPQAAIQAVIDTARERAKAKLKEKGVTAANVYDKLLENALTKKKAAKKGNKKDAKRRPTPPADVRANVPAAKGNNGKGTWPAKVVIVEYSDFQCPFCSKATPAVNEIMKTYGKDVYFIYKHNPLGFHPNAEPAARAANAAGLQGKFFPMHDKLFANYRSLTTDNFNKWAGEIGLNVAKFKKDFASPAVKASVAKDQAEANKIGARGTPNFFVNGVPVRGALPFSAFKPIIDKEIKKADALIKKGTPLAKVYAAVMKEAGKPVGGKAKARPQRPAAPKGPVKVNNHPADATWGAKDAKVTIYEFSDFECPFCGRGAKTIDEVKKAYPKNVRVVFKNLPLSFHKNADVAARAGVAANNQGKFWAMHDKMFENYKSLEEPNLLRFAKEVGLNMAKFNKDLNSASTRSKVDADKAEAGRVGARGTPNFYINGEHIAGARPFADFKAKIDAALAKKK